MDLKIIGFIAFVLIAVLFRFLLSEKSLKTKDKYVLPVDIKMRIDQKFSNPADKKEVLEMMDEIGSNSFSVGKDQLIRSILIIANEDKNKIRQIIDSNYYGDGRDVIMEAMGTPGNTNDHGMTPFKKEDE